MLWASAMERGFAAPLWLTFKQALELGGHVRKGEKALVLCQPVTIKRSTESHDGTDETIAFTRFTYRPRWFVLTQTDGADLPPVLERYVANLANATMR